MEETTNTMQEATEAAENDNGEAANAHECEAEATGRLRDEKGHFMPNPNKPERSSRKSRRAKKAGAKAMDEETVKIRIVKEEEPLPPKEFEGKLEDMKERTATQFVKSVCRRKPRRISIDGNAYYSQEVVDDLIRENIEESGDNQEAHALIEEEMKVIDNGLATILTLKNRLEEVERSRSIWRGIAFGLLAMCISYFGSKAVQKFCFNSSPASSIFVEQATSSSQV